MSGLPFGKELVILFYSFLVFVKNPTLLPPNHLRWTLQVLSDRLTRVYTYVSLFQGSVIDSNISPKTVLIIRYLLTVNLRLKEVNVCYAVWPKIPHYKVIKTNPKFSFIYIFALI